MCAASSSQEFIEFCECFQEQSEAAVFIPYIHSNFIIHDDCFFIIFNANGYVEFILCEFLRFQDAAVKFV
jgi:hypothetical protein